MTSHPDRALQRKGSSVDSLQFSFLRDLFYVESSVDAAQILASTLVNGGYSRAIVCRLSVDEKDLVVMASAGSSHLPASQERLELKRNYFTQKTFRDRRQLVFYSSDLRTYGRSPWWTMIPDVALNVWIESPIICSDLPCGVVYLDVGPNEVEISRSLKQFSEKMTSDFNHYYTRIRQLEKVDLLLTAEDTFPELDVAITSELSFGLTKEFPKIGSICSMLARHIVYITGATICDISLENDGIYIPVAQAGELEGIGRTAGLSGDLAESSITIQAIHNADRVTYIGDRSKEPIVKEMRASLDNPEKRELLDSLRSWGAFPIVVKDSIPGAISVASTDWDFFTSWRLHVLDLLSQKAALMLTVEKIIDESAFQLEQQQKEIRDLSVRMTEVASRSGFAAAARIILHNIRNMMQPFATDIDKLRKWSDKYNHKRAQKILEELEGRLEKVEEALDFHERLRSGSGSKDYYNLNELLREAIEFCMYKANTFSISIDFREAPHNTKILCSEADMLQAFMNVILNGIESMIDPSLRGRAKRLVIRASYAQKKATIKFEDSGVGIRKEDQNKVWEPDYTTKESGTGLGMPHIRRTIRSCNGKVVLSSKPSKGTTLTLTLPARV